MAIKGSLREASLPDVLQLLALGQKTGCLSVTDRSSFGYIYFNSGRIIYASIVNRRDRLGDILVKSGAITAQQLDTAIATQGRERDKRLGQILLEQGAVAREELHRHIRIQIEEAIYFLFTWTQGTFSFEVDVAPEEREVLVSVNPESLLLEGARRVDEWSLIEKKLPSFDVIFELDRTRLAQSEATLTAEQERLLPLIDGRRDAAALVEESGLGEFDVGKALFGLATAGFIRRVGKSRPVDARQGARVEEHRNLGVAFYKTGMFEEAMREFRRVIDLRPADVSARFYVGLVLLRTARWTEAVEAFREAAEQSNTRPAVFHNLAYALERQARYAEARLALEEAVARGGGDDARVQTSRGVLALRAGDLDAAETSLAAARPLWGKRPPAAAWFHYAALAAALRGEPERALTLLREGLEAHPHSAALHNTVTVLHEQRGDVRMAALSAERGLQEDGRLPQLHRNLGDCYYRAGRYDEALGAYQRALELDPTCGGEVHFKLGNIHYKRQERDQAVACWERALALDPDNDVIRVNLDLVRTVGV